MAKAITQSKAPARRPALIHGPVLKAACLLLLLTLAGGLRQFDAMAQASNEYQVKAAFLYNFAKFVEWPSESLGDPSVPLIIGIVGRDPFGGVLEQTLAGKTVNGHALQVQRLNWDQNLRACHILFISQSERKRVGQILGIVRGSNTLTIGEVDQFNQQGGIINFVIDQNKVRFEINSTAAEQAGLKISARLLSLAKPARAGN